MSANNTTLYNRYKSRILANQGQMMVSGANNNNKTVTKSHILGSMYRLTLFFK